MHVLITYCVEWGFFSTASRVAAAIKSELGLEAKLLQGHNGVFQVSVDGELVYDNQMKCGPMPKPEDVVASIQTLGKPADGP